MQRVLSKDITVLIQGALDEDKIGKCVKSYKEKLPEAQIIISTWKKQKCDIPVCDECVFLDDPGAEMYDWGGGHKNNTNRQLYGKKAGLEYVRRKYVLVTRPDIYLLDDSFLDYYDVYGDNIYPALHKRLLIVNFYTRNPRIFPLMYHPSDWILFGETDDVKNYYDIPLMTKYDMNFFGEKDVLGRNLKAKFTPEQYIFTSFIRKYEEIGVQCINQKNENAVTHTEKLFAECFVVLDYKKQFNIEFIKYNPNKHLDHFSLISYSMWKLLYEVWCKSEKKKRVWWRYIFWKAYSNTIGYFISIKRKIGG